MGYIVTINSESKQALDLVSFLKSLDFVSVKKETKKTALAKPATALNSKQAVLALTKTRTKNNISQQEIIEECREVRAEMYEK